MKYKAFGFFFGPDLSGETQHYPPLPPDSYLDNSASTGYTIYSYPVEVWNGFIRNGCKAG